MSRLSPLQKVSSSRSEKPLPRPKVLASLRSLGSYPKLFFAFSLILRASGLFATRKEGPSISTSRR